MSFALAEPSATVFPLPLTLSSIGGEGTRQELEPVPNC